MKRLIVVSMLICAAWLFATAPISRGQEAGPPSATGEQAAPDQKAADESPGQAAGEKPADPAGESPGQAAIEMAEKRLAEVKAGLSFKIVPAKDLPELWAPGLKPEDNAAPLYEQAFAKSVLLQSRFESEHSERVEALKADTSLSDEQRHDREAQLKAEEEQYERLTQEHQQIRLMYGFDRPEEAVYYDEEKDEYVTLKPPAKDPERAARFFAELKDALALRDQAVARPGYRQDLDWSQGINVLLPNLSPMMTLAKVTDLEAAIAADAGRTADAYAAVAKLLQMSRHVEQEPILINVLVASHMRGMAVQRLAVLVAAGPPSAEMSQRLTALLTGDTSHLLHEATISEVLIFGPVWDDLASGKMSLSDLQSIRGAAGSDPLRESVGKMALAIGRPAILYGQAGYLQWMDAYARAAAKPAPEAAAEFRRIENQLRTMVSRASSTGVPNVGAALMAMFTPVFGRVAESMYTDDARCRAVRIGLVLAAWQAAHKEFPAALTDLPKADALPADPFSGKPFNYWRQGDGFMLWSVGPDGDNDGGRTQLELAAEAFNRGEDVPDTGANGDIVFRVGTTAAPAEKP